MITYLIRWLQYELHALEYGFYMTISYLAYHAGEKKDAEEAMNHANNVIGRMDRASIQS